MQRFHPLSFILGLVSGVLVLVIVVSGVRHFWPSSSVGGSSGYFQGGQNTSRMAQRFGITQAELQKELDSGKTIQQIAQEHGVQFGGRRNGSSVPGQSVTGSGALSAGSGVTVPPQSASSH